MTNAVYEYRGVCSTVNTFRDMLPYKTNICFIMSIRVSSSFRSISGVLHSNLSRTLVFHHDLSRRFSSKHFKTSHCFFFFLRWKSKDGIHVICSVSSHPGHSQHQKFSGSKLDFFDFI